MKPSIARPAGQCQDQTIDRLKLKSKERLRFETSEEVCGHHKKAVAYELHTSDAQLSRYLGDGYPDDLPAHKVAYLTRFAGPGYMMWLARECGGEYHHGEHAAHPHEAIVTLLGLLAKQEGTALQQLLQDLDHLTVAADVPPLRRMQAIVEELIADVEGSGQ